MKHSVIAGPELRPALRTTSKFHKERGLSRPEVQLSDAIRHTWVESSAHSSPSGTILAFWEFHVERAEHRKLLTRTSGDGAHQLGQNPERSNSVAPDLCCWISRGCFTSNVSEEHARIHQHDESESK